MCMRTGIFEAHMERCVLVPCRQCHHLSLSGSVCVWIRQGMSGAWLWSVSGFGCVRWDCVAQDASWEHGHGGGVRCSVECEHGGDGPAASMARHTEHRGMGQHHSGTQDCVHSLGSNHHRYPTGFPKCKGQQAMVCSPKSSQLAVWGFFWWEDIAVM